ncbi:hypothetical protein M8J77_024572 [Diaphorina citri]|nr:hypothetical protein M8J77_024572 [Diaphorina citri]
MSVKVSSRLVIQDQTIHTPRYKLCEEFQTFRLKLKQKTQWIGINQIIEDLAFEASVAMFIGLIEDLQVQGQQGQHLTFHI